MLFLRYVRQCLQKQISSKYLTQTWNATCEEASNSFFDNHLPCYLDEKPKSFCQIPIADAAKVLWNAKDLFWTGYFGKATGTGWNIAKACNLNT